MAADYKATVADLLTAVRDFYTLPTYDEGSDARLLRVLNREQLGYLQKKLIAARAEYRDATYAITVVSGQLAYDIPTRAIASGLTMIQAVDVSGNQWLMVEVRPTDAPNRLGPVWVAPGRQFYLQRNQIIFYSAPPAGTILVRYPMRLAQLVPDGSFATVASITNSTQVVFTGTLATGQTDVIAAVPQFDTLAMDKAVTVSSTTATFTAGVPDRLAVGSYLCAADTSPVCQAPLELHPLLCCRASYVTLKSKGDPFAKDAKEQLDEMAADAAALLAPRPGKPRSDVNYAGPGWRNGWASGWRGGVS